MKAPWAHSILATASLAALACVLLVHEASSTQAGSPQMAASGVGVKLPANRGATIPASVTLSATPRRSAGVAGAGLQAVEVDSRGHGLDEADRQRRAADVRGFLDAVDLLPRELDPDRRAERRRRQAPGQPRLQFGLVLTVLVVARALRLHVHRHLGEPRSFAGGAVGAEGRRDGEKHR